MNEVCTDAAFGALTYSFQWHKSDTLSLFGKKWNIDVGVQVYAPEETVSDLQRENYRWFLDNLGKITKQVETSLSEYVNTYCLELAETWPGARMVRSPEGLGDIVRPTALQFQQDGRVILLLDCQWDEENGLAVQIRPKLAIGIQSAFL